MCGLVGMAGQLTVKSERAFGDMLVVDSVRGVHSTGVASIKRNGDTSVFKIVGAGSDMIDTKGYENLMKGFHKVLIGHNRFATQGKVSRQNAHPFEIGNLIGAHNGTLTNKWTLHNGNIHDVDSMALYDHIATFGLKAAIEKARGAWALTWWDKDKNSINFIRNDERPLYLCESEDGKEMFWASESWMLYGMLGRNGIKHSTPFLLQKDSHLEIILDEKGEMVDEVWTECKSPQYFQQGFQQHSHYQQQQTQTQQTTTTQTSSATSSTKSLTEELSPASCIPFVRDVDYAGSKDCVLQLRLSTNDSTGGTYFTCFDQDRPTIEGIRLYINTGPESVLKSGDKIVANIHPKIYKNPYGFYYFKVEVSSVKIYEEDKKVEESDEEVFFDFKGNPMSLANWKRKYHQCVYCTGSVEPDTATLIDNDDALCGDCATDPQLRSFVK